METAHLAGKTWDDVQGKVRKYAKDHDLDVNPEHYLPLEDARVTGLYLFRKGALASMVRFSPFFHSDGTTFKDVRADYDKGHGAEDILRHLGVEL